MPFEKFNPEEKNIRKGGEKRPTVTITVNGDITLNAGAVAAAQLLNSDDHRVDLLYDPEKHYLGIQFDNESGAIPLEMRQLTARIKARRFISRFGLGNYTRRVYGMAWNADARMIVVDLDGKSEKLNRGRPPFKEKARMHTKEEPTPGDEKDADDMLAEDDPPTIEEKGYQAIRAEEAEIAAVAAGDFDYTGDIPDADPADEGGAPATIDTPAEGVESPF